MLRTKIFEKKEPYFVADIGANHDGDINRAFMLIELVKESGAHAAKFQNFVANKIVSRKGFDNMGAQLSHQKNWKKSVYETYEDAALKPDWPYLLKEKCNEVGIEYFTSAYDFESVDLVDPLVSVYKIGSGDITWIDMLEYIARKHKPILLATGASTISDVERAMNTLGKFTSDVVLMQCNTNYTGSSENFKYINLNVLNTYKHLFPKAVLGLSDHTPGHTTVLGALSLGASVFEKHFTDDNNRDGPDHKFAMNPGTWRAMVEASRELLEAMGDGEKKIEANEEKTSLVQRRALRMNKDLSVGTIISEVDIYPLRPYDPSGLHPHEKHLILGKKLARSITADSLITLSDISND